MIKLIISLLLISFSTILCSQSKKDSSKPEQKLTIQERYLTIQKDKNRVMYSPDSDRKSASYTHYIFPLKNYYDKVGKDTVSDGTIFTIQIIKTEKENYKPQDPRLQSPIDGFDITNIHAEIISVSNPK